MTSRLTRPRRGARSLVAGALLVLAACTADTTAPDTPDTPGSSFHPALVRVTLSGLGSSQVHASAAMATPLSVPLSNPSAAPAHARFAPSADLTSPVNGSGTGNGSIQLEPLSTGSFTQGERGTDGVRYFWATFRVRNAQSDSTPYDTPRQNLTFFATTTGSTLGGSAIASLGRFDGGATDPSIAPDIVPTGAVDQALEGGIASRGPDVLQVLTADEAAAVTAPTGVTVLPYGFVVRNPSDPTSRTLPASPAVGQFDGVVTFAFKVPLQASASDDPFTISAMFLAEEDGETRITQSLEEQTPEGEAAFLARATTIGATMKTVLPGSDYVDDQSETRSICTVRTAGSASSPTAYLVHRPVASMSLGGAAAGWPLWPGGGVARDLGLVFRDGAGVPLQAVPVQVNPDDAGVLTRWGTGGVRMLPRRDRASTTVTVSACGVTSSPLALHTSGFIPLASGDFHSLGVKSDGTVVAWGDNNHGQATVPAGLTGVVQITAGFFHSLALKSDGTVATWGDNFYGQMNVPPGLSDVVQVAARGSHSLALKADGTVVAWGRNFEGQANVPAGLASVVQVAAGSFHSLALKSDGTVVAWGRSDFADYGQATVPPGLTNVVQLSGAGEHSLALKGDGTVVGWGRNEGGEMNVPAELTDVVQISDGGFHALALKSDGTVVAWGDNTYGQTNVPPGLTGVVQVAAGDDHSLALKADGTIVAWGYNEEGETNVPPGLVAAMP